MSKISPCIWCHGYAEELAKFYVSLLPDSRIDHIQKSVIDHPGGQEGGVLLVRFTLAGQQYMALNGDHSAEHSHAISFSIDCEDQAEIDRLWDALLEGGGEPICCGWLKDRFGVRWQVVPRVIPELLGGSDPAGAKRVMKAVMGMIKLDVAALEAAYAGEPAA
ncbi:MAG TPA: VOC family protein [Stellaceae bacterium]|nr:VOC family protein [Stellaceae bacterium]